MLWEMWNRLRLRYNSKHHSYRSLASSISQHEFHDYKKRKGRQNLPRFYSQEGFEDNVKNSEEVVELFDSTSTTLMGSDRTTLLLGFISTETSKESDSTFDDDFSSIAYSEFKRCDSSLDRALSECNRIRIKPGFNQGLLLKSVESNPMFPFMHYALFNSKNNISISDDAYLKESKSIFGVYEELFAIQKSSTFIQPSTLPTHRHSGFIISNFKILDRSRQQQLEKNWLYWSGAKEIYRYSPRAWNLRKISLLKVKTGQSFAYILLCEFGQILHPSNIVLALDMCERLKDRVCGHFSLYGVQHSYFAAETTNNIFRTNQADIAVGSPRSIHTPIARSPQMSSLSSSRLASPSKISKMGVSQEVDASSSRRLALTRMRDRSLGYESRFHSYHMFEELT